MNFKTVERPSYFGKKRDQIQMGYDEKYGKGDWRIAWEFGEHILPFEQAIQIYEDSYYLSLKENPEFVHELITTAKEVFDNAESNIHSELDYSIQENNSNHYQDISVRRVLFRLGCKFRGKELIQIRHNSKSVIGQLLSPGTILFHQIPSITKPHKRGWWEDDTVECFWQSNKVLQVIQK